MLVLFVLAACGSGGHPATDDLSDFLQGWGDQGFTRAPDYEGQPVLVDEKERVIYIDDCDLARQATHADGLYGPDGPTGGYGYVCDN